MMGGATPRDGLQLLSIDTEVHPNCPSSHRPLLMCNPSRETPRSPACPLKSTMRRNARDASFPATTCCNLSLKSTAMRSRGCYRLRGRCSCDRGMGTRHCCSLGVEKFCFLQHLCYAEGLVLAERPAGVDPDHIPDVALIVLIVRLQKGRKGEDRVMHRAQEPRGPPAAQP